MMNERKHGTVIRWNDDKGFGFIRNDHDNSEIFFHIRDYRGKQRPEIGEKIFFILDADKQGRPCAKNVQEFDFVVQKVAEQTQRNQMRREREEQRSEADNILNGVAIFALVFYGAMSIFCFLSNKDIAKFIFLAYTATSIITYFMYWNDKNKAHNGEWRTPEANLHLWAVLGGWIGASFAHKLLNHKSRKTEFRIVFYITIIINIFAVAFLCGKL